MRFVLPLALALLAACSARPEPSWDSYAPTIHQDPIGANACGPCALFNALLAGGDEHAAAAEGLEGATAEDKIRTLIEHYGEVSSTVYRGTRDRYDPKTGVASGDMELIANEFLGSRGLPTVAGTWFDRLEETRSEQLRRVHALLSNSAFPPIIEVRSFHADVKEEGPPLWEGIGGHYLVVVDVDPIPAEGDVSGFEMRCSDSANGRVIPVFVALERFRLYTATRGFTVDDNGKEQWTWKRRSPYLLLTAPDLRMNTHKADWHERSYLAMTWGLVSVK